MIVLNDKASKTIAPRWYNGIRAHMRIIFHEYYR